jgi:hypothetical protein
MAKYFRNKHFQCQCGIRVGLCNEIDHPQKVIFKEEVGGEFLEGWALGKYNHRESKWGQHVYNFKWHPVEDFEKSIKRQELAVHEIYKGMTYFWAQYIKDGLKPFNYIYAMPGSTGKHPSLAKALATKFALDGYKILPEFIELNSKIVGSAKEIKDIDSRTEYVNNKFIWNGVQIPSDVRSILFLDDVYETGATLKRASEIIREANYNGVLFFMVAAYL